MEIYSKLFFFFESYIFELLISFMAKCNVFFPVTLGFSPELRGSLRRIYRYSKSTTVQYPFFTN